MSAQLDNIYFKLSLPSSLNHLAKTVRDLFNICSRITQIQLERFSDLDRAFESVINYSLGMKIFKDFSYFLPEEKGESSSIPKFQKDFTAVKQGGSFVQSLRIVENTIGIVLDTWATVDLLNKYKITPFSFGDMVKYISQISLRDRRPFEFLNRIPSDKATHWALIAVGVCSIAHSFFEGWQVESKIDKKNGLQETPFKNIIPSVFLTVQHVLYLQQREDIALGVSLCNNVFNLVNSWQQQNKV